jgi:hypothetical protein
MRTPMSRLIPTTGVLAALLAGCAPEPIRIDTALRAGLKDEAQIRVLSYEPSRIFVQTRAGQAANSTAGQLGLIGALVGLGAMAVEEKQRAEVAALGLPDPAERVRERFLAGVTTELGLTNLAAQTQRLPGDGLDEVARAVGRGLAFDVSTFNWGLTPDQFSASAYALSYRARARLIRAEDRKVLWLGFCSGSPADESGRGPSYDDFVANQGRLLREKSSTLADRCAAELIDQLLGRAAPRT